MSNPASGTRSLDDAKAIQALLIQLGQSQALKQAQNQQLEVVTTLAPQTENSGASTSVASLLSQLQAPVGDWTSYQHTPANTETDIERQQGHLNRVPHNPIPIPDSLLPAPKLRSENFNDSTDNRHPDLRHYSFQQSLPILAELANRKDCVDSFATMKKKQDALERQLLEERMSIKKKYEQKIKDALFKARLVGSVLSPHEVRMLNDGYRDELRKFDRERAISAWEELVAQQQETLSSLGVPAMFPTHVGPEKEVQQKVVHVLEGLIGTAP